MKMYILCDLDQIYRADTRSAMIKAFFKRELADKMADELGLMRKEFILASNELSNFNHNNSIDKITIDLDHSKEKIYKALGSILEAREIAKNSSSLTEAKKLFVAGLSCSEKVKEDLNKLIDDSTYPHYYFLDRLHVIEADLVHEYQEIE